MTIEEFFSAHKKAALGFSGGVDSAYLLYAGMSCGADICAYYIKTAFQPAFELADARELADKLGARLRIIDLGMPDGETLKNPSDRCRLCKRSMFGALKSLAERDGYSCILDGTNASDDADDRPGMKVVRELGVLSPLRECGLTKPEIRERSKAAGLKTWDKPAYSCLATRIQTGTQITRELLGRVEGAEDAVRKMGYTDIRVRTDGNSAVLRVPAAMLDRAISEREGICAAVAPYFKELSIADRESEKHG